ncbi:hypothetical protein [Candidatus Venteria ishoeyi]|uniref:Uncharacterized protein n=1 Tax=Candidatus Venteria ishoeyi TaxID=1899563 RepID=A0A1H6FC27_9GAMM|nr:hypothetical protein [Candidatus Venteria ishoeyi]SEH07642.1 Uncharacterised protein [Candidatus Venteria ishoeyi]
MSADFRAYRILTLICLLCAFSAEVLAETTHFNVTAQAFKNRRGDLSIPGAEALELNIKGEMDARHDTLRVYNMRQGKTHKELLRIKGQRDKKTGKYRLNHLLPLQKILPTSQIRVTFNSNNKTTQHHLKVSIERLTPIKRLAQIQNEVTKALTDITHQGARKSYAEIQKNIIIFQHLSEKLQASRKLDRQTRNEVSQALQNLASSYLRIVQHRNVVQPANQKLAGDLQKLQSRTIAQENQIYQRIEAVEKELLILQKNYRLKMAANLMQAAAKRY